jgi:hypothetical protein
VAQSGSAPVWGTGGRRFKSGRPDQTSCVEPARWPVPFDSGSGGPIREVQTRTGILTPSAHRSYGACPHQVRARNTGPEQIFQCLPARPAAGAPSSACTNCTAIKAMSAAGGASTVRTSITALASRPTSFRSGWNAPRFASCHRSPLTSCATALSPPGAESRTAEHDRHCGPVLDRLERLVVSAVSTNDCREPARRPGATDRGSAPIGDLRTCNDMASGDAPVAPAA